MCTAFHRTRREKEQSSLRKLSSTQRKTQQNTKKHGRCHKFPDRSSVIRFTSTPYRVQSVLLRDSTDKAPRQHVRMDPKNSNPKEGTVLQTLPDESGTIRDNPVQLVRFLAFLAWCVANTYCMYFAPFVSLACRSASSHSLETVDGSEPGADVTSLFHDTCTGAGGCQKEGTGLDCRALVAHTLHHGGNAFRF